jgi:hypothetical protein
LSTPEIVVPSSPADRLKLKGMFKEFSNSKVKQAAEADHQNSIAQRAKEDFKMRPEDFRTLATMYHTGSRDKVEAISEAKLAAYDNIVNAKAPAEAEADAQ